jgi:hypothetical protein
MADQIQSLEDDLAYERETRLQGELLNLKKKQRKIYNRVG